jgi:hypothetical protein
MATGGIVEESGVEEDDDDDDDADEARSDSTLIQLLHTHSVLPSSFISIILTDHCFPLHLFPSY